MKTVHDNRANAADRTEEDCPLTIERPLPSPLGAECNDRVTFRVNAEYVEAIDELVEAGYYANQSQALREGAKQVVDDALDAYEDGGSR